MTAWEGRGAFLAGAGAAANFFATSSPPPRRMASMSRTGRSNVSTAASSTSTSKSFFSVPAPIKQLFDQFPLLTYPVNQSPQRAPQHRHAHVLYVFTTEHGAIRGAPSHNPACLKWQVSTWLPNALPRCMRSPRAGISPLLENPVPHSLSEQPCVAERLAAVRHA